MTYTPIELMIACASRALEDGRTVAVGTGVPCAAAMLAQKTHAPNLVICFEAGGVAPQLPTMPISVGDSRTIHKAVYGDQHGRRHAVLPARHDGLHVPERGPDRPLRQPELDPDRRHYQKPKVRLPGQRRGERPGVVLLADADHHAARRQEVRREARLPDHPRLPDRPRRPRSGRAAGGDRAVPRHHRTGRARLPPDDRSGCAS